MRLDCMWPVKNATPRYNNKPVLEQIHLQLCFDNLTKKKNIYKLSNELANFDPLCTSSLTGT